MQTLYLLVLFLLTASILAFVGLYGVFQDRPWMQRAWEIVGRIFRIALLSLIVAALIYAYGRDARSILASIPAWAWRGIVALAVLIVVLLWYPLHRFRLRWHAAAAIERLRREGGMAEATASGAARQPGPIGEERSTRQAQLASPAQLAPPTPDRETTVAAQIPATTLESHGDIDRTRLLEVLSAWKDMRALVRCSSIPQFDRSSATDEDFRVPGLYSLIFDGFVVGLSEGKLRFRSRTLRISLCSLCSIVSAP